MLNVGDTIGDYRIVSHLNQGGMATLYLGRKTDAPPDEPAKAIKVIHESLSEDWQFVRMFIDEALISVRIRHANVVRVDELGEADNRYFLVMEYVHGCSLAQLLRALGKQGRRMRPEIAVWVATQVAYGLHAAHEMTGDDGQLINVVHRDVSPQNVLLSATGEVKLLDFGIAKAAGRAERTEAGVIKGKIRYMAPEQAQGESLDRRVDVYALAVVLWETLTMRRFIEGKNEVEIIKKVRSPELIPPSFRAQGIEPSIDDAVLSGLALDRDQRPPTAEAFGKRLEAAVPGSKVGASHLSELLRVFVGDELQASAAKLPDGIAEEVAASVSSVRALPGEDESTTSRMSNQRRTANLTVDVPRISLDELDGRKQDESAREEATASGKKPVRVSKPDSIRPTVRTPGPFDQLDVESLPDFSDVEDEEHTMEASGHELQVFLARIREDAAQSGVRPPATEPSQPDLPPSPGLKQLKLPPPRKRPPPPRKRTPDDVAVPAPVQAIEPPAQIEPPAPSAQIQPPAPSAQYPSAEQSTTTPQSPPRPASGRHWILRAILITLVAFTLGASLAVAYVRLLR